MCPVCLANLAFIAAGAISTSGLSALAVRKFLLLKRQAKSLTERNMGRNENGGNQIENGRRQSESV
jgi:hypothetical protein